MGGMTGRSLLARVAIIGALVIGLVGMHHLVIAACHHAGFIDEGTAVAAIPAHGADAVHGHEHGPIPAQPADQGPAPAGGAMGAAAMCLAVLLLFVVVLGPRAWAYLRRLTDRPRYRSFGGVLSVLARPPDLAILSVSRT